jgi:SAM-dependent methyltransferase
MWRTLSTNNMQNSLELIFYKNPAMCTSCEVYEDIHIHQHIGTWTRFVHRHLVKPLSFYLSSRILRREILLAIDGIAGKTVLDVSAGDDSLIFELADTAKQVTANDISAVEMQPLFKGGQLYSNINFTTSNLVDIKGPKSDVVICKNTLHHLNSAGQIEKALKTLKRMAKERIIVMDVENPRGSLVSRLWNDYYRYLLKDQGGFFLTYEQFVRTLQVVFGNCHINTRRIATIKGTYMLAEIIKC